MANERPGSRTIHFGLRKLGADILQACNIDEHIVARALPNSGDAHRKQRHGPVPEPTDLKSLRDMQQLHNRAVNISVEKHPHEADDDQTHQVGQKEKRPKQFFETDIAVQQQRETQCYQIGA